MHPSGVEFDDHITSMVELLSSQYTGTSTFEEEGGSEDGSTQGSLKNRDNLLEAEDSDEDSDDKHVVDEGDDCNVMNFTYPALPCMLCLPCVLCSIHSRHLLYGDHDEPTTDI